MSHYTKADGTRRWFADISDAIEQSHPELANTHIRTQLSALGLYDEFRSGTTPVALPYTFTGCPRPCDLRTLNLSLT